MTRRQKAKSTGIRTTPTSHQVFVRVPSKYRSRYPFKVYSKRFPLATSATDLKNHRDWAALRIRNGLPLNDDATVPDVPAKPTLKDRVPEYLALIQSMPTKAEREDHINRWVRALGDLPWDDITRVHVHAQLEHWRLHGPKKVYDKVAKCFVEIEAPLSESVLNHLRSALSNMYTRLDGQTARNPAKDVPRYTPPESVPRALPWELVEAAFAEMPDTRPTALLRVLRWTGWPHAQIAKLEAHHIDYEGRAVQVMERKKGKGWQPRVLPILPQAVEALQTLRGFGFPGGADTIKEARRRRNRMAGHMRRAWLNALNKVNDKATKNELELSPHARYWLQNARPYDLRHSFGTLLAMLTPDRAARQELMLHSDERQTAHYEKAAASPLAKAALADVARALLAQQLTDENTNKKA